MSERLKSIGLDVGTTSTQLVVSELIIENRASAFAVPDMKITHREILYRSPIHLTPQASGDLIDVQGLRTILESEFRSAGITRADVDTGAVIITGETSRKENARRVLDALADFSGDFVVATAGPDLESILAAKGSGAVSLSESSGKPVLHMDIGGGTTNLALIRDGQIHRTGCLNAGGRLIRFDDNGIITYVSPVLSELCSVTVGDMAREEQLYEIAVVLARALETAAGRGSFPIPVPLFTEEARQPWFPPDEAVTVSFSGGVADCVVESRDWLSFGDIGPLLGRAIRNSRLCSEDYVLGAETIRATVIGAGCHSTQLSGCTVYCQNVQFPLKNLPVVNISRPRDAEAQLSQTEEEVVLAWPGIPSPSYPQIRDIAKDFAPAAQKPLYLCLEQDMAKALGHALALALPPDASILCIDGVRLQEGSYLDVGNPLADAYPVVVKTLVLHQSPESSGKEVIYESTGAFRYGG